MPSQQFGVSQIQGDWIAIINALDASDNPTVLYFSDKGYKDATGRFFLPRMKQPARINVTANDGGLLSVMNPSSTGEIILENVDGGLNYLLDYSLDGRECTLQLVSPQGIVTTWFKGIVTRCYQQDFDFYLTLKSLSESLDYPMSLSRYLGTGGVEGLTTDIKGNIKPRVYGSVINATPVLCFATSGVYQISDFTTCTVSAVYDKGVAITLGATQTTLAALLATNPAAGTFDRFQGYFRLGTMAVQEITCDAADTVTLAGDVFKKVCDDVQFSTPQRVIGEKPVITDGVTHKYQLSVSTTCEIQSVYDNGTELENGGSYATQIEFDSYAPASGQWRSFQGKIRVSPFIDSQYPFGEVAIGTITCDAYDSAVTFTSTYTVSTNTDHITALNSVGAIGLFINSDVNISELLNKIAISCGAFWWFGDSDATTSVYNTNLLCVQTYSEPDTTASLTVYPHRIIGDTVTRSATGVGSNGLPIYSILAKYAKIQTVQTDVLGATTQARKALVAQDSLMQESADLNVKKRHPQAFRIEFESLLISQANTQAVTDRLLAYFKKRCDIIDIEVAYETLPRFVIGITVKVIYDRLGYQNGVNMRLIGYEVDVQQKTVSMRLMGYKI